MGHSAKPFRQHPGQVYTLSFWLQNEQSTSADDFTATYGQTLLALKSAPAQGYTLYTYTVTGTGSDVLEFAARQDPSQWDLDDVSLIPKLVPKLRSPGLCRYRILQTSMTR